MTNTLNNHPVTVLRQTSQSLQEKSMFAERQASNSAARARQASLDLANLDLEKAFRQLREMVAIVGGKNTRTDTTASVIDFPVKKQVAQAAE